ncbi:MAG: arsenate reductase family protein [Cloacibacillus sp.]|nr:arsenate reductase family protein [Cloacibacillus sp.]MCC8178840.1 arsenate reductase family protein [Cloacibacillus sp.]
MKTENPTADEIKAWWKLSGQSLKKFFNTSGNSYKALGLSKKLPELSEDEQITLLAADGMLVKRPLAVLPDRALVGFKEDEWAAALA